MDAGKFACQRENSCMRERLLLRRKLRNETAYDIMKPCLQSITSIREHINTVVYKIVT